MFMHGAVFLAYGKLKSLNQLASLCTILGSQFGQSEWPEVGCIRPEIGG